MTELNRPVYLAPVYYAKVTRDANNKLLITKTGNHFASYHDCPIFEIDGCLWSTVSKLSTLGILRQGNSSFDPSLRIRKNIMWEVKTSNRITTGTYKDVWLYPLISEDTQSNNEQLPENNATETEEELELPPASVTNLEKHYQEYLYRLLGGQKEVETPAGFIDLLTDTDLIEIKNCHNNGGWKSAIGQVVVYRVYYPYHRCFIYLYNVREGDKDLIVRHCDEFNITPMWLK